MISFSFDFAARTVDFYLDGAPVGSETITNPIASINGSSGSGTIGYFPSNITSGQFKGLMNIVGLYNKKLTAQEQLNLYDATKYRFVTQ